MRLRRRDFEDRMRDMQGEMERLFDEFWVQDKLDIKSLPERISGYLQPAEMRKPLTDLKETDTHFTLEMELPGIDKKDVEVNVTEDSIDVRAEHTMKREEKKEGYLRSERTSSSFYRSMMFPARVIPDKAEASFENGLLKVSVPKIEAKKASRKVDVK